MIVSSAEINAWLGSYLWPFFRIGALLVAMPIVGTQLVPVRVRLALALALTAIIAPLVPDVPAVDPLSPDALLLIGQQILIGMSMGFALSLVFGAFVHAGQIIAMQMGLGFASLVDPQYGTSVPVLSQFYLILATLMFFSFDAHHIVIDVLAQSFHTLPIAAYGLTPASLWELAAAAADLFAGALRMALPIVTALLAAHIVLGIVMRTAPQLNVFVLGFILSLLLGFALILITLPGLGPLLEELLAGGFTLMRRVAGGG